MNNPYNKDWTKGRKLRRTPAMNIYTMWGKDKLIELIEEQSIVERNRLSDSEANKKMMHRLGRMIQIATKQYLDGEVGQLESWKLPTNYTSFTKPTSAYFLAASLAYSSKWGEYLSPAQMNYLCHLDAGDYGPMSFTTFVSPEVDDMLDKAEEEARKDDSVFADENFTLDSAMMTAPGPLRLKEDAYQLAFAFYMTMLDKTRGSIPHPFLGEFRMTKTGIDMLDDLGLPELRLVISHKGIWLSAILPNGNYSPAWWCPDGDSLHVHFGYRFTWVLRTFLACLWHDLHHVEESTFIVKSEKAKRPVIQPNTPKEQIILLPRVQRTIQWAEAMKHVWQREEGEGGKRTWPVRAHYRRLEDGDFPSEQAIENALNWHFPEPPYGYTFVKPFEPEGAAEAGSRPPRIVAKGLQAAKVALAKI